MQTRCPLAIIRVFQALTYFLQLVHESSVNAILVMPTLHLILYFIYVFLGFLLDVGIDVNIDGSLYWIEIVDRA